MEAKLKASLSTSIPDEELIAEINERKKRESNVVILNISESNKTAEKTVSTMTGPKG